MLISDATASSDVPVAGDDAGDDAGERYRSTIEAKLASDSRCLFLSKRARKKLLKHTKFENKKAEKKALLKEQKKIVALSKRKEWEEKLASASEEERRELIKSSWDFKKQRIEKKSNERSNKIERLSRARETGQNIVIDLEFSHLMTPKEMQSLVQQIMYCFAVNGRCASPCHLWLTGCSEEMNGRLEKLPGFCKWIIEKERRSYVDVFSNVKENLVYLTADAEAMLDDVDPKKVYIIGGLVDRNRWKGITMIKAKEHGIQTAKLPIRKYLKMSGSQVLTINQVTEILLIFTETRDWNVSFFQVIPERKSCNCVVGKKGEGIEGV